MSAGSSAAGRTRCSQIKPSQRSQIRPSFLRVSADPPVPADPPIGETGVPNGSTGLPCSVTLSGALGAVRWHQRGIEARSLAAVRCHARVAGPSAGPPSPTMSDVQGVFEGPPVAPTCGPAPASAARSGHGPARRRCDTHPRASSVHWSSFRRRCGGRSERYARIAADGLRTGEICFCPVFSGQ